MNHGATSTLEITTPEGVVFALPLAGPVTRFLAFLVDWGCVMVLANLISLVVGLFGIVSRDLAMALTIAAYFIVSIGYGIVTEWYWRGQTIGKRVLNLRVMDARGMRLQFNQVVIRNLLRFVDGLPAWYFVGGVACLVNRQAQRLGDIAANTIVVRQPKLQAPDLNQLMADKYNSFNDHPHLAARLRQGSTPQEAGVALSALLRRNDMDPQARVELFETIAGHFKSKVAFPPEVTEGLSDERYVRNVVDVLFRSPTAQSGGHGPPYKSTRQ